MQSNTVIMAIMKTTQGYSYFSYLPASRILWIWYERWIHQMTFLTASNQEQMQRHVGEPLALSVVLLGFSRHLILDQSKK
jgi:hypothetical protein